MNRRAWGGLALVLALAAGFVKICDQNAARIVRVTVAGIKPAFTISSTRWGASSRNTPTVMTSGGNRRAMSRAWVTAIWRDDPAAKLKPTASAPMATAKRASSSLVTPQILTNTSQRYRSAGCEPCL